MLCFSPLNLVFNFLTARLFIQSGGGRGSKISNVKANKLGIRTPVRVWSEIGYEILGESEIG